MIDDRDPQLLAMFEAEVFEEETVPGKDTDFVESVRREIRRARFGRIALIWAPVAIVLVLVVGFWTPLQGMATMMNYLLMTPIVSLEEGAVAFLLSPINNIAAVVVLSLKLVRYWWRRVRAASYSY